MQIKILEVTKDHRVVQLLKEDLYGRLKELNIILEESKEISYSKFGGKISKINGSKVSSNRIF